MPRAYPWNATVERKQVGVVRNYLGSADWVVGIFPRFFELIHELTGLTARSIGDIGSGGFNGFLDDAGNDDEVRFIRGGHSTALQPANHASIAEFIVHGRDEVRADICTTEQSSVVSLLSKLCWLVWALILAALLEGGRVVWNHGPMVRRG